MYNGFENWTVKCSGKANENRIKKNHTGSSRKMEVYSMIRFFHRSQSERDKIN